MTNGNNRIPGGYATTLPVVVTAYDPSGATIVGPAGYANPITLTNADTSGVTTLSTTAVTAPSTTVTLTYAPSDANSGGLAISGLPVGATQIGATASGVAASAVTPGTFQYIADRFWGLGHTRMLSGTGSVAITSYNSSGSPLPLPSVYAYNVTDAVTVHANVLVNGVSTVQSDEVYTYSQTSPLPSATAEVVTDDKYRQWTLTTTGATYYRDGETLADLNPGTGSSPITGSPPGAITSTFTYPTSGMWQEDVLPHASVSWSNSAVPFTEVFSVGETATFQHYADGTDSLIETSPAAVTNSETTAGAAVHTTISGTTTISPPVAPTSSAIYTIPVAQQSTSPSPGPTVMYSAADWYSGNAAPVQPLDAFTGAEQLVPIPTSCNVPASIATQAWDVVSQQTALRIYNFGTVQRTTLDYFAPGGVGFVCETYAETDTSYRYTTGVVSQKTVIVYTVGVTSVGSLSVLRRH